MVRYYVRMSDWTHTPRGMYDIDLYEDEGFEGKEDFYRKCIAQSSENDEQSGSIDFEELQEEICIIDIEVDERTRVYYFEGPRDATEEANTGISPTCFLGFVDHFLDMESDPNTNKPSEFKKYVTDKIRSFTPYFNRYILTINENEHLIVNLDHEMWL